MQGRLIASRYRIVRELGRGGMGVVYVVEHVHTGDELALKVLLGSAGQDPGALERFKREARASSRIKSEHVVKVIDADVAPELDGAPFLVMELLRGRDLQAEISERGGLPPEEALRYLGDAARALDKSHAAGIVHRDLKPENLFLHRQEGGAIVLKILDFGISKLLGQAGANEMAGAAMTSTGSVMGTPLYMAPEQARGRISEIGPTTDVWAMGLISLQLLTGEVYWRANTVAELMAQVIAEPLYAPSSRWSWLPPEVDRWFFRSCDRDPKLRYPSAGEQLSALVVALGRDRVPLAPASARGEVASGRGLHAPTIDASRHSPEGAAPYAGGRTTTSAVARDGTPSERRPGRSVLFASIGAASLVSVVGATYALRSRSTDMAKSVESASAVTKVEQPEAPAASARARELAAIATVAPLASTSSPAPSIPSDPPPNPTHESRVEKAVAPQHPSRGAANGSVVGASAPTNPPPIAAPLPSVSSPAPPAPIANPPAHPFDPSAL